ncbi:hypothetical protein MTO96_011461 [Rhipicephalus appendiculatus]
MVQVFCRHGTPVAITSDNGKPFVSTLWRNLLKHWGIKDRHTVPYRPAGQMMERHNGTIKQCLRAYCTNHKDWDRHIPEISLAMRTAESVVTGYTPALLCYGRELRTAWEPAGDKEDTEPPEAAHHALAAELRQCLGEVVNIEFHTPGSVILKEQSESVRPNNGLGMAIFRRLFSTASFRKFCPFVKSAKKPKLLTLFDERVTISEDGVFMSSFCVR